jgi:hypothetical protein
MEKDSNYDDIRFFNDEEVQVALMSAVRHPMIKTLLKYSFPNLPYDEVKAIVNECKSIDDFQREVISSTVRRILMDSSAGLSTSGFKELDSNLSYLYISNHRDIVLDTCILNLVLFEKGLVRTASAVGDNLVQRPFVNALSKLTRNFIVKRGEGPRETLLSSKKLSNYIKKLLKQDGQSVWLAQRQGRTKDGNDVTQQGVLKMLALGTGDIPLDQYLNDLRIVPVSISYEYDPTDILKVPELLAQNAQEEYVKSENEDFNSIMSGALGQKKHIHITAGKPLSIINDMGLGTNQVLKQLVTTLDATIQMNYQLWPTNYIAYDLLYNTDRYAANYTEHDKQQFERRLRLRVDVTETDAVTSFLTMYARPVSNKEQINLVHEV